jgi:hypothetical protein
LAILVGVSCGARARRCMITASRFRGCRKDRMRQLSVRCNFDGAEKTRVAWIGDDDETT